jgi:GLPGLI family protein
MKLSFEYKLIIFSLFLPVIILGQNSPKIISYQYILNLFGVPTTQIAYLYFDDTASLFIHSKGKEGQIMKTEDGKDWDGVTLHPRFGGWYQDTIGCVVFKNLKSKKICVRSFFYGVAYLTDEPKLPTLKWDLSEEYRTIGSFNCRKATTRFRGRNYLAWFTLDIPISNGPWKLQGLPGLIVEATDDVGEVKFLFNSIEITSSKMINFTPPTNGKKVDFETYKKADTIEFEKYKKETELKTNITIGRGKINLIEKEYEQ